MVITGDDFEEIERLKKVLAFEFEVKDLGQMCYFLGMEVARLKKGICISQRKCVLDLLTEIGMLGCKPIDTPIAVKKKRRKAKEGKDEKEEGGQLVDKGKY